MITINYIKIKKAQSTGVSDNSQPLVLFQHLKRSVEEKTGPKSYHLQKLWSFPSLDANELLFISTVSAAFSEKAADVN